MRACVHAVCVYVDLYLFSSFPEAKSHSGAQTGLKLVAILPSQPAELWLTAPSKSPWRSTAVWQCMTVHPAAAKQDSKHLLLTTDTCVFDTRVFFIMDKADLASERFHLVDKAFPDVPLAHMGKLRGRKGKLSELRKSFKPENLTGNKWLNLKTSTQI